MIRAVFGDELHTTEAAVLAMFKSEETKNKLKYMLRNPQATFR